MVGVVSGFGIEFFHPFFFGEELGIDAIEEFLGVLGGIDGELLIQIGIGDVVLPNHLALIGAKGAGEQGKHGRFARPIDPDEGAVFARIHLEGNLPIEFLIAVIEFDVLDF